MNKVALDKITLFQELAYIIDKDIKVYHGDRNECYINKKIIYIGDSKDIDDFIIEYLTIVVGFKYYKYCSSDFHIYT